MTSVWKRARVLAVALLAAFTLALPLNGTVNASAGAPAHLIVISLKRQTLWAFDHGHQWLSTYVTTGRHELPTPPGRYHIFQKRSPFKFVSPWPRWSPWYYNPAWTSYAMQFIHGGYFIHDAPWRHAYGPGTAYWGGSHGCVNVPLSPMRRLYKWAHIGDEVDVITS